MAIISLIRHGQASFGSQNYDCLSEIGHRQGRVLGKHFARMGQHFEVCIAGEMQRQQKTATEAMDEMTDPLPELQTDAAFNEYDSDGIFRAYMPQVLQQDPELAGMLGENPRAMFQDKSIFQQAFVAVVELWANNAPHKHELESWDDFISRVHNGISQLGAQYPGKTQVAVFTSGGAISIALGLALGIAPRESLLLSWGIANASITELYASSNGLFLNGFNNFTHLKLACDPELITYR
ncbi:MAG: histidine phosphatase family protein [Nevskiales bacterium]